MTGGIFFGRRDFLVRGIFFLVGGILFGRWDYILVGGIFVVGGIFFSEIEGWNFLQRCTVVWNV